MRAAAFLLVSLSLNAQVFHPSLAWSTFLAPTAGRTRTATDAQGNIYLYTTINSAQAISSCPQAPCRDELPTQKEDVYIVKLTPDGSRILWQRTIGGAGDDSAGAMAVSPAGDVFLAGSTTSRDFPLTAGVLSNVYPAAADQLTGFLMRLDTNGATRYSTLVDAFIGAVAVEPGGSLVFAGSSSWTQLAPTPGVLSLAGNFVTGRLSSDGSRLTMVVRGIGGTLVALDPAGNIVIAGMALDGYPTTAGAFQASARANQCGSSLFPVSCPHQFVSKLSADGSKLLFSTFVSGDSEQTYGLALDSDGSILLAGGTTTSDYPVTPGAFQTAFRSTAASGIFVGVRPLSGYLSRLSPDGSSLLWSTYLGGSGLDCITDLKLASDGTPWVAADLTLSDFPQFDTVGARSHGTAVLGFRRDGSAVTSAIGMPGINQSLNVLLFPSLAIDPSDALIFANAPTPRGLPVTPGVAFANPDPVRIGGGAFVAKVDTHRAAAPVQFVRMVDAVDLQTAPAIVPGQLLTLFAPPPFGAVEPTAAVPLNGLYPTLLGGTQVLFDGVPAPLLYSGPGQVNVAVPFGVASKIASTMSIVQDGASVNTQVLPATPRAPSFFMPSGPLSTLCPIDGINYGGLSVQGGIVHNPDGSQNSCSNPAHPGDVFEFFVNALGPAPGLPADGAVITDPPPVLTVPLVLTLNNVPIQAESATAIPGWIAGVWRIRVRIPADFGSNVASVTLTVDGIAAQPSKIYAWVQY